MRHRPRAGARASRPARLLRAFAAAGALLFAVLSTSATAGAREPADRHAPSHTSSGSRPAVMMHGYAFMPAALVVHVGDTITWTNDDSAAHNLVATAGASFHSPLIRTGQSWSWTATAAGPVRYVCSLHPGMDARLTVLPAPAEPAAATGHAATGRIATTGTAHGTIRRALPAAVPSAAVAPATSAATPATTPAAAGTRTTLDPMLLVVAIAVATVVFCLLLVTGGGSRRGRAERWPDAVPPGWVAASADTLEDVSGGSR